MYRKSRFQSIWNDFQVHGGGLASIHDSAHLRLYGCHDCFTKRSETRANPKEFRGSRPSGPNSVCFEGRILLRHYLSILYILNHSKM